MTPRVLEILDRRAAIRLAVGELCAEDLVLETELRAILEGVAEPEVPDFSMFKDTTRRLLTELWDAPERMLEKEDIRQDVILDEYASDGAVKQVIGRARIEMQEKRFPYVIKTVFNRGYQLVPKGTKRYKMRNTLAGVE